MNIIYSFVRSTAVVYKDELSLRGNEPKKCVVRSIFIRFLMVLFCLNLKGNVYLWSYFCYRQIVLVYKLYEPK